ncbi:hypothetical protein HRbin13_00427 [bacterium HR13]|nr:hypothetical protein HRbin13_00427 [bacterium HR13]
MCGSSKGFTLLEVLVASALLALFFGVLFELISKARRDYYYSVSLYEDIITLTNRLTLNQMEGLGVEEETLKDYPIIKEFTYTYGKGKIYIYAPKK